MSRASCGDDRRRAGAGAAAHAAGDEHQVGALQRARATSSRFSSIAWRPISGRAPAPSPRVSFLPIWTLTSDFDAGQRLGVGVDRDELDALEVLVDHAVDGVAAAAADADDLHPGVLDAALFELEDHGVSLGPSQKKSCSHRLTGPSTFSTAGDLPRAAAERRRSSATCRAP